jgi:signal transduction histidine kinase
MRLLLAEDNPDHGDLIRILLDAQFDELEITTVRRGQEFLDELRRGGYEVALLDFHLPDYDADVVLARTEELASDTPVLIISSDDASSNIIASVRRGGWDFLPKSEAFEPNTLGQRIQETIKRKQARDRIIQAQKDESLALLAGGIAHDFNNMLVGIVGKSALLQRTLPSDSRAREHCLSIQRTAQRLADLARQLLAYAHGGKYQPRLVNVTEAVNDTVAMLRGTVAPGIVLETFAPEKLWATRADHAQLVQCLLNLAVNACEAMGESGTLLIRVENAKMDDEWTCRFGQRHAPGEYVRIEVADTGPGIPSDLQRRIFDPFFSTKGDSRGLGLAAVHGIIRNHAGVVDVTSRTGEGTRFTIHLPRARELSEMDEPTVVEEPTTDNRRSILVVEDETEVADVLCEVLETSDHTVDLVTSVAEAQAKAPVVNHYDAVILDMRLPDGSGREAFAAFRP